MKRILSMVLSIIMIVFVSTSGVMLQTASAEEIYKIDDSFIVSNKENLKEKLINKGKQLSNGNYEFYKKNTFSEYYISADLLYNVEKNAIVMCTDMYYTGGTYKGSSSMVLAIVPINTNEEIEVSVFEIDNTYDYSWAITCNETIKLNPKTFDENTTITFSLEKLTSSAGINNELKESVQKKMNTNLQFMVTVIDELLHNYFAMSIANIGFTKMCQSHTFEKQGSKQICTNCGTYYTESVKNYTVTFNANGGSVTPANATVESGKTTTLPTPTRSGYTCLGWATDSKATTATYKCGASFKPTANITLYATWKANAKLGDVNGDNIINSNDALLVLQYTVGSKSLSDSQKQNADVNKDNKVNSNDALNILQYTVGKINKF